MGSATVRVIPDGATADLAVQVRTFARAELTVDRLEPDKRAMGPLATAPEAYAVQLAIWRRMGPSGRHALVAHMSEDLRELSRSGIRQRHPGWREPEVELALRRLMWGDELFRQVYPDYAAPAP